MSVTTFDLSEATAKLCKRPNFGWKFVGLDSVDSTNNYTKANCGEWLEPTLVVAKHQTQGRGRGQNHWLDEGEGTSFLSTWCMELIEGPANPRWTLGIGLYLYEALSEAFKTIRFSLKEPNDICIGDKKVAGVLVEATQQGELYYVHVGVGINVFSYPAEVKDGATHLNAYLGTSGLSPESWSHFIEFFGSRLLTFEKKAVDAPNGWLKRLSPRLVDALNRHPSHQTSPILSVDGEGNLHHEKGQIGWREI